MSHDDIDLLLSLILPRPRRKMIQNHIAPLLRAYNGRMIFFDCAIVGFVVAWARCFGSMLGDIWYFLGVADMKATLRFHYISKVWVV